MAACRCKEKSTASASAIVLVTGDAQFISDELIGQNQTGIGSGANGASGLYKEDTGERRFIPREIAWQKVAKVV